MNSTRLVAFSSVVLALVSTACGSDTMGIDVGTGGFGGLSLGG